MFCYLKKLFTPKMKLPLWMFVFSTPKYPDQNAVKRISKLLLKDKRIVLLIDSQPHTITYDALTGKVDVYKIEHWKITI